MVITVLRMDQACYRNFHFLIIIKKIKEKKKIEKQDQQNSKKVS